MASLKCPTLQVGAVIAVGLVEGSVRHTNVRLQTTLILWWFLGFGAVMLGTTVFVAQGKLCQLHELLAASAFVAGLGTSSLEHRKPVELLPSYSSLCWF